jgi:hypothetical protein
MYNRPLHNGNWASSLIWGRTRSLEDDSIFNSYVFESTARFAMSNHVWTRIESAERSNELLPGENPLPPNFKEIPIGRVQGYSIGYDRDFDIVPHLSSALGIQVTIYGVPEGLKVIYGSHPAGLVMFVRFRPFSGQEK